MKALVLGGTGFIGSHIVDQLLARRHTVRVFSRTGEKYRSPLAEVDYRTGVLGDSLAMAEALDGVDVVFHAVSTTVPSTSNLDPVADIQTNLVATVKLLEQMVQARVNRIVFLSSGGTVYGNPVAHPAAEDHPLRPLCSYGVVKVALEHYLYMYQRLHDLQPVVIRPSNAYGPRQGHIGVQGVIAAFLNQFKARQPLRVWGDGSVVRDYVYVDDLARLCLLAGETQETGTVNAGSGRGHSITDIIEVVADVVGVTPEVIHEPARTYDVQKSVLDISKAQALFGWTPRTSLKEGIAQQWAWTLRP